MSDIQKIIAKIKKLNRLATSKNPEEAANAAAFAARLMQEYQIEQAQIEANEGESNEVYGDYLLTENGKSWRFALGHSVGKICESLVYKSGNDDSLRIIGSESNAQGARYLFMLISRQINDMANHGWTKLNKDSLDIFADDAPSIDATGKEWKRSFRLGCCNTIRERIELQIQKNADELRIKAMGDAGTRGVLAVIDRNQGKIKAITSKMRWGTARQERQSASMSGYNAGKSAGHSVNIGRGAKGAVGAGNKAIK